MPSNFNIFDPSQWVDVTGFIVVVIVTVLTLVGVVFKLAASGKWSDWLDEAHGRGSVDDGWDEADHLMPSSPEMAARSKGET